MEIIEQDEKRAVCELESAASITEEFISSLAWPEGRKVYVFRISDTSAFEPELAGRIADKGRVWIVYRAKKAEFAAAAEPAPGHGLNSAPLSTVEEVRRIFVETKEGYYKAHGYTSTPRQLQETKEFISKMLPASKHLHLERGGKTAAFILVNSYKYLEVPTDIIPWFWVAPGLDGVARAAAIALMRNWLRENMAEQVHDFCNLDRPEFIALDRGLGLDPVAIHVLKTA